MFGTWSLLLAESGLAEDWSLLGLIILVITLMCMWAWFVYRPGVKR
jgi:hypothetical protein